MSYTHFTEKEIIAIEIYKKEWYNYYQISKKLNRSHTSIWRIIKKYKDEKNWIFSANKCIKQRKKLRSEINRKNKQRIKKWSLLEKYILKNIKKYWSPEQIAWRWKLENKENISKDTIYKYIYENYPEFVKKYFRRKAKKYIKKRKEKYQIMDRKMIDIRPKEVDERNRIWDWEADTIVWIRWWSKEVILTNVERKSLYLMARKIKNKSWESVLEATIELFKNIPKYKKKTITYDNWREFSEHRMIEYFTWLEVYFAHPYASWERWTNENINWLLRQFLPKKTDFKNISQNQLKKFINLLNYRPRKKLNFKTPFEVFFSI